MVARICIMILIQSSSSDLGGILLHPMPLIASIKVFINQSSALLPHAAAPHAATFTYFCDGHLTYGLFFFFSCAPTGMYLLDC